MRNLGEETGVINARPERRHIWTIGVDDSQGGLIAACNAQGLGLVALADRRALEAAARSPHQALPIGTLVDAKVIQDFLSLRTGEAPRAAVLRQCPFVVMGDDHEPGCQGLTSPCGRTVTCIPRSTPAATVIAQLTAAAAARELLHPTAVTNGLKLWPARLGVSRGDRTVDLTPREYQLLCLFLRANGDLVSRAGLFASVWVEGRVCGKVLDVHVSKLRKKLGQLGLGVSFRKPQHYELTVDSVT